VTSNEITDEVYGLKPVPFKLRPAPFKTSTCSESR
jgi:hypothetical protein